MVRFSPTCPVFFGEGVVNDLGNQAIGLGVSKVIVLTDEFIVKTDGYKLCIKSLKDTGIGVVEFTECIADSPSDVVHAASELAKAEKVDGVVGIGGGSVLDTAKGVNLLFNNPAPVTDYFGAPPQKPGYPLICIPTTAGTGSEVTAIGVITNSQTGAKGPAVFSPASLAILDPIMTLTAPPSITAATGMDAFSHAAESMTSIVENPKADLLALDAIKRIVQSLPKAVENGNDMAARADLLLASNFAGLAFGDALIHFGHAIAHSAGAKFHLAHGVCCALAVPVVMKCSVKVKADKVKLIGEAIGLSFGADDSPDIIGDKVADGLWKLLKSVRIPSFKDLGVSREDFLGLVDMVMSDIGFNFIPEPISKEDVLYYLEMTYDKYQ